MQAPARVASRCSRSTWCVGAARPTRPTARPTLFPRHLRACRPGCSPRDPWRPRRYDQVPLLPQWMATLAALLGQTEDRSDIGIKVAALASASVLIDRMPSKVRRQAVRAGRPREGGLGGRADWESGQAVPQW